MGPSAPYQTAALHAPSPLHTAAASTSFQPAFAAQQPDPRALHIATAAAGAHAPDPEEQTAHPLRSRGQHGLLADAEEDPSHSEHGSDAAAPSESIADAMTHGPGPHGGLTRSLTHKERELINHLDRLKFFLATAPSRWSGDDPSSAAAAAAGLPVGHPSSAHPALNRFLLPNSEYVSCVLWGGLYHITGTDIVRALVFRFEAFGRPVRNMKKFEEGVFSDLRNLKPGMDACLEEPKSPFLDLLFKYQCIRTQKKQKVFYWFSVPHDRLFLDALERDLKREKMGMEPTTVVIGEPALSFTYDSKRSLYEQFSKAQSGSDNEGETDGALRAEQGTSESDGESTSASAPSDVESEASAKPKKKFGPASPFFSMFSLFEGSPTYKQRRKKLHRTRRTPPDAYSMDNYMGRMREPHVDRYGRDTTRMSAGELFMAQARGDFDGQSNPDLIASQKERQRRALEAQFALANRQRFVDPARAGGMPQPTLAHDMQAPMMMEGVQPAMLAPFPGHMPQRPPPHSRHTFPNADFPHHARSLSQPFPSTSGVPFVDVDAWQGGGAPPDMLGECSTRAKAFVCPLFSCGRMFKRMEHLKRHLRTHTLERPYLCERCQKRFSRSDNLAQHVRTHLRTDDGGEPGPEGDQELEEADPDVNVGDAQMYEVELQGPVHEVQGDEEGLVMAAGAVPVGGPSDEVQDGFYQTQSMNPSPDGGNYMQTEGSPGSQWATVRPHSSMSYTAGQPMRMSPPTFGISNDYGLSISAPSHKATFDHGTLYPPELDVGGPGPIRRHRSVTPARYGENIRRPYSVASDHGVPVGRSYHPYAHAYSAESSPMASTVPLGYSGAAPMAALSRAHSRAGSGSSNELQDQMRQMMTLQQTEMDADHSQAAFMRDPMLTSYSAPTFRTDSPMQYATTTGNEYELVNMLPAQDASQQVPMYGLYGLPEQHGDHYSTQVTVSDGSYSTFTHGDPQQVLM